MVAGDYLTVGGIFNFKEEKISWPSSNYHNWSLFGGEKNIVKKRTL